MASFNFYHFPQNYLLRNAKEKLPTAVDSRKIKKKPTDIYSNFWALKSNSISNFSSFLFNRTLITHLILGNDKKTKKS